MQNAADANDLIQLVSLCRDRLRSDGMGFEVISDLDEYERAMSEIGKEENYPMASTSMHDMTTEDAMGVLIRRGDDLIGGVASRLMHLGGDGLARHLQKSARRYYGGNRREMVHGVCSGADDVRGRAVYEGELFLAEGWRGRAVNLPAVMHFGSRNLCAHMVARLDLCIHPAPPRQQGRSIRLLGLLRGGAALDAPWRAPESRRMLADAQAARSGRGGAVLYVTPRQLRGYTGKE